MFEVFDDKVELRLNSNLYIAVLCTYTWSVLQFTFVRTATAETVADHDPLEEKKNEIKNSMRGRPVSRERERERENGITFKYTTSLHESRK